MLPLVFFFIRPELKKQFFFQIFLLHIKGSNPCLKNTKKKKLKKNVFCKISEILPKKLKFLVVKNRVFWQKNKIFSKNWNFWSWKIGFFDKKKSYWNMFKSVANRQNEKKITKIESSSKININPYPKWYHSANSRVTMLVWTQIVFFDP